MRFTRRGFMAAAGLTIGAGATTIAATRESGPDTRDPPPKAEAPPATEPSPDFTRFASGDEWDNVRRQFTFSPDMVHLSALLLAAHPEPVRQAIEAYRRALDTDPTQYVHENNDRLRDASMSAAARYLGVETKQVALTESTTMGLALVYHGLKLKPGQEILVSEQDYYVTHEATRLAARRTGALIRRLSLFPDIGEVTADAMVGRIVENINDKTRAVALTYVHSSTGLKMPVRQIADRIVEINKKRDEADHVLLSVDGVHGFANQDITMESLGCDFFVAGCHKWLFGPRGTGIVVAGKRGFKDVLPTIPSFTDGASWAAWQKGRDAPDTIQTGWGLMPGGFKAFEHQWALAEAFKFHETIGKQKVAARTAELATRLKEGMGAIEKLRLITPNPPELSAGIVSFDIEDMSPNAVVRKLRERRIIASVAPYARPHVRLTPAITNTPAEIDYALEELGKIKADPPKSVSKRS
ncbi:MAG: aminotransferase class V-fold PLP-dependent enzyme [Alphaproteobacteria bacterium]|nr:aminotransferase class V-fold PLP-dependent enzyme [Alphaproteobacteria bacterium]